jgi:hypothetical protein
MNELIFNEEHIKNRIFTIRGKQVMLDSDLAKLYEVSTSRINEQVKRNIERFPNDFMFRLTNKEWENLKSQCATSSWGGRRKLPNVFTEQGIFYDGQVFDAYKFVTELIKKAKKLIILIDNYVDETILTLFSKNQKINVTIHTKNISRQLKLDLDRYNAQYKPIEIKKFNKAHDRFLIIDNKEVYHFGASLKDLGKKWFAFSKFDMEAIEILRNLE